MKRLVSVLAFAACVAWGHLAVAAELVTLPTRPGVTQSYWLFAHAHPKVVAVLFPGGAGAMQLHEEGGVVKFKMKSNFLVRTRTELRDDEVAVALADAPSDNQGGMSDLFRASPKHQQDIGTVVQDLRRRFPEAKVYLVGTSRGTVSAAYLASGLGHMIDGVVLTSTAYNAGRHNDPGLSGFDFGSLPGRVLLVHHAQDECWVTPYSEAVKLSKRKGFPLITVRGGDAPRSDACEALSAHGYLGREAETITAIRQWLLEQPYPANVGSVQ